MIEKFLTIENVGKFRSCKAAGDVALRRTTLLYAENGRGKTTLCDILRSLQSNNPEYVQGRTTLGPTSVPRVDVRFDGFKTSFDGKCWTRSVPELRIFDSLFIHQNVYAGELVEHEQKRNLYRVIVGEKGVSLAKAIDSLDADIRKADATIRMASVPIAKLAPESLSFDKYVSLEQDPNIDEKIAAKEAGLIALRRAEEIATKPILSLLIVSTLPPTLPTVLAKQLDDVSEATEARVKDHLANHSSGAAEPWLSQGLAYEQNDECPFCQQSTKDNELINAYRIYFGATYAALKNEVKELRQAVEQFGTEADELRIEQTLNSNHELAQFWRQFVNVKNLEFDSREFLESMRELRNFAIAAVEKKAGSILEPTTLNQEFGAASERFEAARAAASQYNEIVGSVNAILSEKKGQTGSRNLTHEEKELVLQKATKRRFEEDAVAVCNVYLTAMVEKKSFEKEKNIAKKELDEFSGDLLSVFQKRINELLEMVVAGFRLTNIAREYKGRSPRSTYQVLINDVAVQLGDENTRPSEPAFRNTLSAGDRSTLALAIFLAQLELDPDLESKIVIFDDPFTSQDLSRRTWTQQRICRIAKRAKQVIVLSHEPRFLRLIHDASNASLVKTLQFCRIGQEDTTITPWDIMDATRGDYVKAHGILTLFANDSQGEHRAVAQTIRPVLEAYFRFKFPGAFKPNEWLGDFIGKIRSAADGSVLAAAKKILESLEDINDYSKKYHHTTNPNADSEPINDGELLSYVRRTLELVGGF